MTDFLWYMFEFIVTVFESFVCTHFICTFFNLDFSSKHGKKVYIGGSIVFAIIIMIMNGLTVYEGVFGIIYSLIHFLYALFFLKGSVLKKIFVSILANIIALCVSALVSTSISAVFGKDINLVFTEKTLSRFIMIVIAQILLVYIYGAILKLFVQKEFSLKLKEWVLIFSVFVMSFISLAFIHMTELQEQLPSSATRLLLISELGIIIINVICFYMTIALSKSNRETTALKLLQQQEEYRSQYAENVKSQYEETRRIRHDMKQNFAVIEALQKENKLEEAIAYTEKCASSLSRLNIIIDVGNDFVNAILNSKLSVAKEKGIEVICSSTKMSTGIEDIDLCDLLGNVLDNAIEASVKCVAGKACIEMSIAEDEDKLVLCVKNVVCKPVFKNNPLLKTDKENKKMHGFGVATVKSIAEKYHGSADFYEVNGCFCCSVLLYK